MQNFDTAENAGRKLFIITTDDAFKKLIEGLFNYIDSPFSISLLRKYTHQNFRSDKEFVSKVVRPFKKCSETATRNRTSKIKHYFVILERILSPNFQCTLGL